MIALLIFMVIALGLATGEISALATHRANVFRDEALRLAEDELTRLKGERFTLNGTSPSLAQAAWSAPQDLTVNIRNAPTVFRRSFQITDIAGTATAMKRIDIAVGWTHGTSQVLLLPTNRNTQASLSTIITQSN